MDKHINQKKVRVNTLISDRSDFKGKLLGLKKNFK